MLRAVTLCGMITLSRGLRLVTGALKVATNGMSIISVNRIPFARIGLAMGRCVSQPDDQPVLCAQLSISGPF